MAVPTSTDLLDYDSIFAKLSGAARAWLAELEIHDELGSTNTHLVERARRHDVNGRV